MELGRNEKCHCKSGKKYKKCCYEKDKLEKLETLKKEDYERKDDFHINSNAPQIKRTRRNWGKSK